MAKRNIWVLPMNEQYEIKQLIYADDINTVCNNCGRLIKNVAIVQNSKWDKFEVGLDCAETLEQHEISNYREYEDKKRAYRRYVKLILDIKKKLKDGKITKVYRIADQWVATPSNSYRVCFGINGITIGYIWTFHVYRSTREMFGEWVEKNFADIIEDYIKTEQPNKNIF